MPGAVARRRASFFYVPTVSLKGFAIKRIMRITRVVALFALLPAALLAQDEITLESLAGTVTGLVTRVYLSSISFATHTNHVYLEYTRGEKRVVEKWAHCQFSGHSEWEEIEDWTCTQSTNSYRKKIPIAYQ